MARYFDTVLPDVGEQSTINGPTTVDLAAVDVLSDFGVNRLSVTAIESSGTSAWRDEQVVFIGVTDPINPSIERPEQIRDRILLPCRC